MKYLKTFNESSNISIFGEEWKKFLPKKIGIITSNGEFELVNSSGKKPTSGDKPDIVVCGVGDEINVSYYQKTFDGPNDVLEDGEPDSLSLDVHLTKNENGLKILVNIIYGEAPMFEFSIESPNKIVVSHYSGVGSLYDSKYSFALTDESIKDLILFFNSFNSGLKLTPKDFTFLDKDPDSYTFNNELPGQDEESLKNSLKTEPLQKFENYKPISDDVKKIHILLNKKYKISTGKINIGEDKDMKSISVNGKSIPLNRPLLRKSYAVNKIYLDVKDELKKYSESSIRRSIKDFIGSI